MPVWMDVLRNVVGYAAFVGVATFNTSSETTHETSERCDGDG